MQRFIVHYITMYLRVSYTSRVSLPVCAFREKIRESAFPFSVLLVISKPCYCIAQGSTRQDLTMVKSHSSVVSQEVGCYTYFSYLGGVFTWFIMHFLPENTYHQNVIKWNQTSRKLDERNDYKSTIDNTTIITAYDYILLYPAPS